MLNRIINERLTVRRTDEEIDRMLNENMNNGVQSFGNTTSEEVVQIPDVELSSIDTTKLPGFMDIDKIEQNAQDITPQEKPKANLDDLLKSNVQTPVSVPETPKIHEGKFFNFFEEPPIEQNNNQSDFNLENFFSSMNSDNLNNNNQNSTEKVEPSVPSIEPTIPEVPTMPNMEPSVPSIEPTIPEVPTMPNTEPSVPSIEPTIPEVPTMPNTEPSVPSIEPTIPEVSTMPNVESNITQTVTNSNDSTPIYEVPIAENTMEIPTIDTQTPSTTNVNNQNVENNIAAQNNGTTITAAVPSIRLALNTIRECENTLEKYGFTVDVEEIDFEDSYQVIFKIEKK